jgi:hypothetical protein
VEAPLDSRRLRVLNPTVQGDEHKFAACAHNGHGRVAVKSELFRFVKASHFAPVFFIVCLTPNLGK